MMASDRPKHVASYFLINSSIRIF